MGKCQECGKRKQIRVVVNNGRIMELCEECENSHEKEGS
jgi:hypothetical protein